MTGVDEMQQQAAAELERASVEVVRLASLLNDVCWYNFEISCAAWKAPWRQSVQESHVTLYGRLWSYGGRLRQPKWYHGPVCAAPICPTVILMRELDDAIEYEEACKEAHDAFEEWAPGGCRYTELAATTNVGRSFSSGWVDLE